MTTYIATRDLPPTVYVKGDVVLTQPLPLSVVAIMLATGLIEEVPEKKEWRVEDLGEGTRYFYHNEQGAEFDTWQNWDDDIYRRATGNCFETEELAQAAYDKLMKK
jgi:hypothetical protein